MFSFPFSFHRLITAVPLWGMVVCLLTLSGCGYPQVTGKVLFDDGSPLTTGQVVFENPHRIVTVDIQPDGSYSLSTEGKVGIPSGTYKISLRKVEVEKESGENQPTQYLVDSRYLSAGVSGLVANVKSDMVYMVVVEKPKNKP